MYLILLFENNELVYVPNTCDTETLLFGNGCRQLVINNPSERVVGHESFWQLDVSVRSLMEALEQPLRPQYITALMPKYRMVFLLCSLFYFSSCYFLQLILFNFVQNRKNTQFKLLIF